MKTPPHFSTVKPGMLQLAELGIDEISWSYEQPPMLEPHKFFEQRGYGVKVDPMPCHAHDADLVWESLLACRERAPLCNPVTVNVFSLQEARATNGWAQQQWAYCRHKRRCSCSVSFEDGTSRARNWDGVIVLSGKTTEIHPAVARYVVPHEYGHILAYALGMIRHDGGGLDHAHVLLREWAKARGIPEWAFKLPYSPPNHHLMPTEVFANDFRSYVMEAETDWWPHDEVVRQLGRPGTKRAQRWWDAAVSDLQRSYRDAVDALS